MKTTLPTLAVLGAGNSIETGPAYNNLLNAERAAELINDGLANPDLVFTLGKGPQDDQYSVTEAEYLQQQILDRLDEASPHFALDVESTTSGKNILQLASLVNQYNIDRIGIVCIPWQDKRVVEMAKMALGSGVQVEAFPSSSQRTRVGIIKERMLYEIFKASQLSIGGEGIEAYEQALTRYERFVGTGKGTAVRLVNSPVAARLGVTPTTRYGG